VKLDLHVHSTASDGSLSPSAVAWAARAGGLDVIALTDHDTCAGISEALAAMPDSLHLIPGIELSATLDGNDLHILGYFIDHTHASMVRYAGAALDRRAERVRQILKLLAKYSVNLTFDDVAAENGAGVLGRPHIARAMLRKGYVQTVAEAFDRFLGDDRPCFLPTELLHPSEAIALIHETGGVSLWAHPRMDLFERILPDLLEWGIRGVECIRPRIAPSEIQYFEESARHRNLLISGGSDWHGVWHGKLGEFYVRSDEVAALLDVGGL
jgi:predicted metal-dependent phosphoesterase TrpH